MADVCQVRFLEIWRSNTAFIELSKRYWKVKVQEDWIGDVASRLFLTNYLWRRPGSWLITGNRFYKPGLCFPLSGRRWNCRYGQITCVWKHKSNQITILTGGWSFWTQTWAKAVLMRQVVLLHETIQFISVGIKQQITSRKTFLCPKDMATHTHTHPPKTCVNTDICTAYTYPWANGHYLH